MIKLGTPRSAVRLACCSNTFLAFKLVIVLAYFSDTSLSSDHEIKKDSTVVPHLRNRSLYSRNKASLSDAILAETGLTFLFGLAFKPINKDR